MGIVTGVLYFTFRIRDVHRGSNEGWEEEGVERVILSVLLDRFVNCERR